MERWHYLDLIRYKSSLDLKSDVSQAHLGLLWWVLEPLLYLVTFYVVFELIMKRGGEGFVAFLLCGLVFWRWFDTSIKKAASSIQSNIGIINQVYLPKIIFPVMETVIATYRFFLLLIILLVFLAIYQGGIAWSWLSLPAVMLVQLTFSLGLGACLSALLPFIPDLRKLVDNALMFMFWLSGVFFDISQLSERAQTYLSLNPMAVLLQQYRMVLLDGGWPDWSRLVVILALSLVLVAVGAVMLKRWDTVFARVIR